MRSFVLDVITRRLCTVNYTAQRVNESTEQPIPQSAGEPVVKRPILDLALYVLVFAAFVGVSVLIATLKIQSPLLRLTSALVCNIVIIGGGALLVNALRGTFSLRASGLWPVRIDWSWIVIALGLAVVILPLRVAVGLIVAQLFEGGLASVQRRSDLLMGGAEFNALTAAISLIGAGVLAPIAEELLFRGGIFSFFRSRLPLWPAAVLSGALFALGHADSAAVVAASFGIGVANAWLFDKSKTLWTPIFVHIANNSAAVVLLQLVLLLKPYLPTAVPGG